MRTIWQSLIWREWQEHKWKLAALTAIMLSAQSVLIGQDPKRELYFIVMYLIVVWLVGGVSGAYFVGLGTASRERADGTLAFVKAWPIPTRYAAFAKLALGAITCVVPVLAAMTLAASWLAIWQATHGAIAYRELFAQHRDPFADLFRSGLAASCVTLSVYLWTAAAGINQRSELRAAMAGALTLVLWVGVCIVALLVDHLARHQRPGDLNAISASIIAMGPAAGLSFLERTSPMWFVALQLLSMAGVAAWTVSRFGRIRGFDLGLPHASANAAQQLPLAAPRRQPWRAMAWKHWREAVPMCAAGTGLMAGMTVIYAIIGWTFSGEIDWSANEELPGFLRGLAMFVGTLIALVVGVSSFAADVQPGVWAFWRSRPIQPGIWFWPKFWAGALAVLAIVDLPLVVGNLIAGAGDETLFFDGMLACAPLLHVLAYSAAVCAICWLRQPIYSGILAVAFMLAVVLGPYSWPSLEWLSLDEVIGTLRAVKNSSAQQVLIYVYLPFAITTFTLAAAAMLLAWQGIKFDGSFPSWRRRSQEQPS